MSGNNGLRGFGHPPDDDTWFYDDFTTLPDSSVTYKQPTKIGRFRPTIWARTGTPMWGVKSGAMTSYNGANESRIIYPCPSAYFSLVVKMNGCGNNGISFRGTATGEMMFYNYVGVEGRIYLYEGSTYTVRYSIPGPPVSVNAEVRIDNTPTTFKVYIDGSLRLSKEDTAYGDVWNRNIMLRGGDEVNVSRYSSIGCYRLQDNYPW